MLDGTVVQMLHVALDGLAMRQRVVADNIANIETPGFLAGRVQFERELRAAIDKGDSPAQVRPGVARSLEPTRINGNNVNLDQQVLTHMDTTLRYQMLLRILDGKYNGIRRVIGGQG
ncbi:flagellar basal body rod protein FlgB [Planomonospora parontospora subsp. parontospora]|uniref:Flagellar basal body rod protein FlgB n=2 Tax=Planomonospora parontospora TaxID=58119 RepID=A0AA37BJP0_9ACTN|nr:flagellar basal body rod protein FlgB [Planomonospora parontospora]GII11076.1 flagellar basal body rod protein FlgB [Planomonospora parontospora subsp. parontospora]